MEEFDGARIVGTYTTTQARTLAPRTGFDVALEALNGALADAGMTLDEIDGFASMVSGWPPNDSYWAYQLDRKFKWTGNIALPSIMEAARMISLGHLNAVAVVFSGVRPTNTAVAPWTESHSEWTGWPGSLPDQPVQFGLVARRYAHEIGPKAIQGMAEVAATIRNFGTINPDAVYFARGTFTAEEVLASRYVADPLTLLMCSSVTDGGCAMILARADRKAGNGKKGVKVVTGAALSVYPAYHESPYLEGYYEQGQVFRDAISRAGISMDDIDVVEFYDHFSSHVLLQYEQFGFCGKGEAPDLVLSGASKLGGKYPTCTDGGNHSFSHPGFPIVFRCIEAVRQLRGQAKDLCPGWAEGNHTFDPSMCRLVKDAKMAFVSSPGTPTLQGSMMVLAGD